MRRLALLVATLVLLTGPDSFGVPAPAAAAEVLTSVSVVGSPFRGGTGRRARVRLRVRLAAKARLTVQALRYGGAVARTLVRDVPRDAGTWTFAWDGRGRRGRLVPDGPYRLRVTLTRGDHTERLERWVTKAPGKPFVPAPGSVVVAINPGHGGSDTGADVRGVRESDVNLAISLRLRRMLEAAGIRVVMTRTADRDVNSPPVDADGDGTIDHRDELVVRNDIAARARADLTLNIHNNATACRCRSGTEMFISTGRPWSDANRSLAWAVQRAHVRRLRAFEDRTWEVRDRGLGVGSYISISGMRVAWPRPSLMPAILGESLYLDRAPERRRLTDAAVQTAIAAAYYDGVVGYLSERRRAVHYSAVSVPRTVEGGARATVRVRIRATGREALQGWRLEARLVRAVPVFDGTGARGSLVGSVRVPRLARGRARDLSLPITLPRQPGDWLVKLDLVRGDTRLHRAGIVQPQLPISTVAP